MNLLALELVDDALQAGIQTRYALFDSWFACPRMFRELLKRGIHGVGMIKQTKKAYFRYRGREMSVKVLYAKLKKASCHSTKIICTVRLCNMTLMVSRCQ